MRNRRARATSCRMGRRERVLCSENAERRNPCSPAVRHPPAARLLLVLACLFAAAPAGQTPPLLPIKRPRPAKSPSTLAARALLLESDARRSRVGSRRLAPPRDPRAPSNRRAAKRDRRRSRGAVRRADPGDVERGGDPGGAMPSSVSWGALHGGRPGRAAASLAPRRRESTLASRHEGCRGGRRRRVVR